MTAPSHYLVKQAENGAPIWTLEIQAPRPGRLDLRTFGSSALVSFGDERQLRVDLETGVTATLTSEQLSSPTDLRVDGDAASVVLAWVESRESPRRLLEVEVAAFDHGVSGRWSRSTRAGALSP
ncbi:MAG: hypothetical protein H6713_03015 [Myxococcales bacterium]|nr:hypothetical protein [Myxococcales bacterium]